MSMRSAPRLWIAGAVIALSLLPVVGRAEETVATSRGGKLVLSDGTTVPFEELVCMGQEVQAPLHWTCHTDGLRVGFQGSTRILPFDRLHSLTILESEVVQPRWSRRGHLQGKAVVVTTDGRTLMTPFHASDLYVVLEDPLTGKLSRERYEWCDGSSGQLRVRVIVFND